jgi:hypothetical protein
MSPAIVDEVLKALAYPRVRKLVRADNDAEAWFEAIILLSDLVPGEYTIQGVSDDPDDDPRLRLVVS